MAALDLFRRRHVLRLVWELRDGPVGFREMQIRCDDLSPSGLRTSRWQNVVGFRAGESSVVHDEVSAFRHAKSGASGRLQGERGRGSGLRSTNGHLHLASLRAALEREVTETVGATCHDDLVSVA